MESKFYKLTRSNTNCKIIGTSCSEIIPWSGQKSMISCSVCLPKFTLRSLSVRDRPTLLLKKYKEKMRNQEQGMKCDEETELKMAFYLILWSWAGGILRILQSDWFRERAVFSYLLTTVMVTNYAKRKVKLRIERARFQFVLIVFCNR